MIVVVVLLALGVVILAHKSADASAGLANPPGASNGVTTPNAQTSMVTPLSADNSTPALGGSGVVSPYTGVGLPGANAQYKNILFMQKGVGGRKYNALMSTPKVKGTGLLDPLPDKGTRSKQLLTKDVVRGPGQKL